MTSTKVVVKERGHTDVGAAVWASLSNDYAFHRLLGSGILSANLLANGLGRLRGSCYVGRAQCADLTIEIQEKVPGALQSLLSYAAGSAFRVESIASPASGLGPLTVLLIQQFLAAVTRYVSRSRDSVYEKERKVACLVGGQIDIAKSIQLRARGLGHLLAFNRNVLTFNTSFNRTILATLIEIGRIAQLLDIEPRTVERARGLAFLFADCRDSRLLVGDRARFVREARSLVDSILPPEQRDVAALATVILAHEGFQWDGHAGSHVPRSWFLNLETLFEQAVRAELRDAAGAGTFVVSGAHDKRPVFEERTSQYRGQPDVVVTHPDGRVIVGDVKYKDWTHGAVAPDLYQLLVHTAAFSGTRGFLAFPSDKYEAVWLGRAVTGTDTWLFALDLRDLKQSVNRMASDLDIETGSPGERIGGTNRAVD